MKAKRLVCNRLNDHIGFSLAFTVLFSELLCVQSVNVYMNGVAPSNCDSEHSYGKCNSSSNVHDEYAVDANNRTGKFFFDALFNINTSLGDDLDDDDDADDVKTCNCGEWLAH